MWSLKVIEFVLAATPDPAGGAYSAQRDPLTGKGYVEIQYGGHLFLKTDLLEMFLNLTKFWPRTLLKSFRVRTLHDNTDATSYM